MITREIKNLSEIDAAAGWLLGLFPEKRVFAFYAGMGAGKTTFISALVRSLKSGDAVKSPTFAIIHEYIAGDQSHIYHFDFYRLTKKEEVPATGFQDFAYSGNWCFIEWPELAEEYLPEDTIRVEIETRDDNTRILRVK